MYRNRRVMVRPPPSPACPCPPGVDPETGEIHEVSHRIDQAMESALFQLLGRRAIRRPRQASFRIISIASLVFIWLVILAGFLVNGVSITPHYEPVKQSYPASEWLWDNGGSYR